MFLLFRDFYEIKAKFTFLAVWLIILIFFCVRGTRIKKLRVALGSHINDIDYNETPE